MNTLNLTNKEFCALFDIFSCIDDMTPKDLGIEEEFKIIYTKIDQLDTKMHKRIKWN